MSQVNMVEPGQQRPGQVLEQQWKQSLPTHLIVLFDSLSNVDFVNLTKRTLKDKVETLKVAVAKEFAKRDGKLTVDPQVKKESSRTGSVSPDTQVSSSSSLIKQRSLHCSLSQGKSRPSLEVEKQNQSQERHRDGRDRDRNGNTSRTANNTSNQTSEKMINKKQSNTKLSTSSVACPPKFSDLIKMASKSSSREINGSRSSTSDPASPPSLPLERQRLNNPLPENYRRSHQEGHSKSRSFQESSRPDDRSRLNERPGQNVIQNGRSSDRSGYYDQRRTQSTNSSRDRLLMNNSKNGRPGSGDSRTQVNGRPAVSGRPNVMTSAGRVDQRKNSRDSLASCNSNDNRSRRDNCDNNQEVCTKDKPVERKLGSRMKRKEEDERIEEMKRRRIREDQERIKLRNEALTGKRSAQTELKTFVSKSQGSTVLSCGKPPARTMMRPPEDDRRDYSDYDRGRRPMRPRMDRDPHARRELRYDPSHPDECDDEEYDPDMDDFIDDDADAEDGFIDEGDVSHHIREIFGYDKRKYADLDDDDIEEASYATIQKEEARSAMLGRKEDLEDIKLEAKMKREKRKRFIVDDDEDDEDR